MGPSEMLSGNLSEHHSALSAMQLPQDFPHWYLDHITKPRNIVDGKPVEHIHRTFIKISLIEEKS